MQLPTHSTSRMHSNILDCFKVLSKKNPTKIEQDGEDQQTSSQPKRKILPKL